ncbi:MAG TPA: 3-keto-5-aminohexanoate cleavage protein, partial [Alphaproteobacteria bacterium]|nr:3-keto-5-aminohexanoate cleavage protein [Alphaproteobacteria bacterium]
MSRKVWIEVALNGAWTRAQQPNVPVTPDELIADALA